MRKAVPWSEGSTKEEQWGNATQSTRQDPQQFSDFSERMWGPLPLLENCTSLACRQKASISPGARRGRSHWALENTLEALCLNLLFPFYSISDLSSPPDPFCSHRLPFFSKLASHTGWWNTTCQTAAPLNTAGICRIGRPERVDSDARGESTGRNFPANLRLWHREPLAPTLGTLRLISGPNQRVTAAEEEVRAL